MSVYFKRPLFFFIPFVMLLVCCGYAQNALYQGIKFNHVSTKDGLPQNSVFGIVQDQEGFMWFGTDDGLCKYDGYGFTIYRHIPDHGNTISSNVIRAIAIDAYGFIWIGTNGGGVNRFDPLTEKFDVFKNDPSDPQSISHNKIFSLFADHEGAIWAGTLGEGVNKLTYWNNPREHKEATIDIVRYQHKEGDASSLSDNKIWSVYEDREEQLWAATFDGGVNKYDRENDRFVPYPIVLDNDKTASKAVKTIFEDSFGQIWMGTEDDGLYRFDRNTGKFKHYPFHPNSSHGISHFNITSIVEDFKRQLWVGTLGGGLNYFDREQDRFVHYRENVDNPYSLKGSSVYTIYESTSGILWMGMVSGQGLNKIDPKEQQFEHYQSFANDPNSLRGTLVKAIYQDSKDNLWVGTFGGGLNLYDDQNKRFIHYLNIHGDLRSISSNNVQKIYEDKAGTLWVGTDGGGLNKFDRESGKFIRYQHRPQAPESLGNDEVWDILEDKNGTLWVGAANGGGLNAFDRQKDIFTRYRHMPGNPKSLSFNDVRVLYEDSNGTLWAGTYGGGLNKLHNEENNFTVYKNDPDDPNSLSNDVITAIYEDKAGNFWIGTFGGGLNKFDRENETFFAYREKHGLPNDVVKAILEDAAGNLWISTIKGLSTFDLETETFRNYSVSDGLQAEEFNVGSAFKNKEGKMFFGGTHGYNAFFPEKIKEDTLQPKVVITNLRVLNKAVIPEQEISGQIILNKSISATREITLNHDNNVFLFEFAALDYSSQDKIKYAYKLEGEDEDWIYTDARRRYAPYSNLNAGTYTFKVMAFDNTHNRNDQYAAVKVNILPPWWKSQWAYAGYAVFLVVMLYLSKVVISIRYKLKNDLKIERLEREKAQEVNQMKLQFFTNISHELRTPLTLIMVPLENLVKNAELSTRIRDSLAHIYRNADRLLRLINQLMDFRKQETGNMQLEVAEGNLVKFAEEVKLSFNELAGQRQIIYHFIAPQREIKVWYDRDQMEKVLYNLLSNAFKFTRDGGEISVVVNKVKSVKQNSTEIKESAEITVEDNGKGIPLDHIDHIFNRFFQLESADHPHISGTGIGLALTKGLVELHKGTITVSSEPDRKTRFMVRLPLGNAHFGDEVMIKEFKDSEYSGHYYPLQEQVSPPPTQHLSSIAETPTKTATVLVIEDNEEVRLLLKNYLKEQYQVEEAENGKEGLEKAVKMLPDLIISDIMMPEMDGIVLCTRLKTDIRTSHIPVILLTARTALIYKVEGYETGADAYITKPFHLELLEVRVKTLIESRKKLREKFSKSFNLEPKEVTITSPDEKLLRKAVEIVEAHMSDPEFDVNILIQEIGMSRSVLYKKLPALTDLSPNEFIHLIRLKRAAQFLSQNKLSIAEVCYEVGFKTPRYFSKCFRKQYGQTPSEYAESQTGAVSTNKLSL